MGTPSSQSRIQPTLPAWALRGWELPRRMGSLIAYRLVAAQRARDASAGRTAPTRLGLPSVLAAVLLLAGCAGTPARESSRADAGLRGSIAALALSMAGVPYRYGGADPREGFDCSGLVYFTYAENGVAVPRTSRSQFDAARKIDAGKVAQGDLLFFSDQEKLSHVGIYLGDGRFIHAPSTGGRVRVERVDDPYYQAHLVAAGQLLP